MNKIFMLALSLLVVVGFSACDKKAATGNGAKSVLKVASDTTFPPMEFVDDNKNIVGFDVDVLNAVGDAEGFTPQFETVAWDSIFSTLENGSDDVVASSVSATDERKLKYDFSDPYVNVGQVLVVPIADTRTSKLADLAGKQVGVQIGTTGDQAAQAIRVVTVKGYSDIALAFQDLAQGTLAGILIDSPIAADYSMNNPTFKGKVKIVGDLITSEPYEYAVKKGNADLLAKLNAGLAAITASGKLDEIKAKWGIR